MDARGGMDYADFAQQAGQAWKSKLGGLGSLLGGIFNDPRHAYAEGQRAYDRNMDRAEGAYNPFYQSGIEGMGKYKDWLSGMSNPQDFINKLMGGYQESPYAKYLQQQAGAAGTNAASASGLIGSTPWAQQMQQNAAGISSGDMQDWLSRVLGINSEYGRGQQNLMGQGFNAAQGLGNIFGQNARDQAQMAYGKERAGDERSGNILGGLFQMFS
jgi:hypothetical protein